MCYSPRYVKSRDSTFPCGRCAKCIARRVSAWSFRLMQELRVSSSAHFITLTYDSRFVPITNSGFMDLSKRDVQLFFKRLRKAHSKSESDLGLFPIKYYACGEYGGRSCRPHYHIILFNAKLELIQDAWSKCWKEFPYKRPKKRFAHMGMIDYGDSRGVCEAAVGYCLKYMSKDKKKMKAWLRGRQPEFALMSKGLGIDYLSEEMVDWHIADMVNRMYCNVPGGKKISMPRYYKDKMYLENERSAIAEAMSLKVHEKELEKLIKFTVKDIRNEKEAIKASYDRMYLSSLKTRI